MLDLEIRREIIEVVKRLYRRGLNTTFSGNVSARASDERRFWITPTNRDKYRLRPEDLSLVDIETGERVFGEKQSSEYKLHLMIYRKRSDVKAVIHAHATHANILARWLRIDASRALFNRFFEDFYEAKSYIDKYDIVDRFDPGSWELAEAVSEAFSRDPGVTIVLMLDHGLVSIGSSLVEALNRVEVFEDLSKIFLYELLLMK